MVQLIIKLLLFDYSCKPLNDREHNFYRTLPHVLHPFTPKFEGVMSVAMHEDENGYITLMGTPPNCYGLKQNRCHRGEREHPMGGNTPTVVGQGAPLQ
jgi:hypothetical protein